MHPKRIYIIAGEASGDTHGAVLMREMATLVPDLQFFGAGGPEMRLIAGNHFMDWTQEAVVGLHDLLRSGVLSLCEIFLGRVQLRARHRYTVASRAAVEQGHAEREQERASRPIDSRIGTAVGAQ